MNGIINVLKPPGMMSNGVVVFLRRILGVKKIGHTGTLDPGAAGVLPICVGKCTKLSDYIMNHEKVYMAEITFGKATDTLDAYGKCIVEKESNVSEQALKNACEKFIGKIEQTPPMYSAVKVNGKKLYEMARKGIEADVPLRTVEIFSIDILERTAEQSWLMRIKCSKGTYVRTLLQDIGESLGELAYTSFLMRESSGGYHVSNSYTLDEIREFAEKGEFSFVNAPDTALMDMPRYDIKANRLKAVMNGIPIDVKLKEDSRIYCNENFLGIGTNTENGMKLKLHLADYGEL